MNLSSLLRRPARTILVLAGLGTVAAVTAVAVGVTGIEPAPERTVTVANETTTTTTTSQDDAPTDQDGAAPTRQDATVPIVASRRGRAATADHPPVESTAEAEDSQELALFDSTRTVQFRNVYSSAVNVAILYYSPDKCGGEWGDWEASGWYVLEPGETKQLLRTSNRYFAYYAKSADGRAQWPAQSGSGLVPVMAPSSAFQHCLNLDSHQVPSVWMKSVKMASGSGTSTYNLKP